MAYSGVNRVGLKGFGAVIFGRAVVVVVVFGVVVVVVFGAVVIEEVDFRM